MRQTTRRKYYGRSNMAASLRTAQSQLDEAIRIAEQEAAKPAETPLAKTLRGVLDSINWALESERIYNMERKRLRGKLEREKANIESIIQEITAVPVFKEEKVAAKAKRKKEKVKLERSSHDTEQF